MPEIGHTTTEISHDSDDEDDDNWNSIEKVIRAREKETNVNNKCEISSSKEKIIEKILNIDDFFGVNDEKPVTDSFTDYSADSSFQLQHAIERSLIEVASTFSCSYHHYKENDIPEVPLSSSSSASASCCFSPSSSSFSLPLSKLSDITKKYQNSPDFNLINFFSDEILVYILSLADYTTQKVCRRWSITQIKVSRIKIVETLTNVSLLTSDSAGQVELELFQLFSKVSKQYRQKARSLIFNLKGIWLIALLFVFCLLYSNHPAIIVTFSI